MQLRQFVDISVGRTVRCSTSSSVIPSELHYSTVLCSAAQWRSAICTGSVLQLVAVQCRCLRNHAWGYCTSLDNTGLHCNPKNNNDLNCYALNTALLCHPLNCTALQCIALHCTALHYNRFLGFLLFIKCIVYQPLQQHAQWIQICKWESRSNTQQFRALHCVELHPIAHWWFAVHYNSSVCTAPPPTLHCTTVSLNYKF